MKKILETSRLALYEFTTDDAAFILQLVNSPGWLQHIGDRNIHTSDDAGQYIVAGLMKNYTDQGFGFWRVALKDSNTSIGMCGLIKRDYLNAPDIGYAFLPEFTNQGYAFEAAQATIDYTAHTLKLGTIIAITNPDNSRSIKLLEKLGMTFERTMLMPGINKQVQVYSTAQH